MIQLKRAYEPPSRLDGKRYLVEALWPRGVRKEDAALDAWLRELAPSTALRRRYHDHEADFDAFRSDYLKELAAPEKQDLLRRLSREAREGTVTLVLAKRDVENSSARVLKGLIDGL